MRSCNYSTRPFLTYSYVNRAFLSLQAAGLVALSDMNMTEKQGKWHSNLPFWIFKHKRSSKGKKVQLYNDEGPGGTSTSRSFPLNADVICNFLPGFQNTARAIVPWGWGSVRVASAMNWRRNVTASLTVWTDMTKWHVSSQSDNTWKGSITGWSRMYSV